MLLAIAPYAGSLKWGVVLGLLSVFSYQCTYSIILDHLRKQILLSVTPYAGSLKWSVALGLRSVLS